MDEGISWPGTPVSSVGTLITKSKATTAYTFYTGPSTISGTITKNGSLYPYASVSLLTTDCLLLRKTFANASGEYSFNNIDTSVKYLIISQDYTLEYNPVIYRT
jgi:hypothetical protein